MERRELLKRIALLTGGIVIGGDLFLTGCKSGNKSDAGFSTANIALLDEVAETIIPATSTPGAKAAKVGDFMKIFVTDCYTPEQQSAFTNGIAQLDAACEKMYKKSFMECDAQQRKDFLISLEKEAKPFNENVLKQNPGTGDKDATLHYYTMMKQLTLLGFFTSKTGGTETLRHIPIPGKYDGAFPYKKGDKAWLES